MREFKPLPSVEYLRECFDYDPATGVLTWRVRPRTHFETKWAWRVSNTKYAGKKAGSRRKDGRHVVHIGNNSRFLISRLVMKWMNGEEPSKTVDHRDADPANDRWGNLRLATSQEQNQNQRLRNSASGFRGVYRSEKRWEARIKANGVIRRLGTYDTPEEAAAIYEAEARRTHGEFYREPSYVAKLASLSPKRRLSSPAVSGFIGVRWTGGAWEARFRHHYLGRFKTPEEAHEAYCAAVGR